ncbi:hypothetical protein SXCC_01188 [Gluconacetobacter sp. SXCC-1]|nr:hypothetical protein SXCC_01188 [Gluconacetobacter sp. SXCC-1]
MPKLSGQFTKGRTVSQQLIEQGALMCRTLTHVTIKMVDAA